MLNLTQRTCKIGNAINTRAEMHGDDCITALDIPLTDIMLDADELNSLLREPLAHRALFDQRGQQRALIQPLFKHLKPLALVDKIEGAIITITHGVTAEVLQLAPVKLAKIKLEPCMGGLTSMSCTVQCTPDLNIDIAHLLERLNACVELAIDGGEFGAQQDLPLNAHGEDEQPEPAPWDEQPAAPPPKVRGRGRKSSNGQRERVQ